MNCGETQKKLLEYRGGPTNLSPRATDERGRVEFLHSAASHFAASHKVAIPAFAVFGWENPVLWA